MNRSNTFELCSHHLATLCAQVAMCGRLNILNLHVHCEDFYADLLNRLLALQLKNANQYVQNVEGFDLIDSLAQVLVQVSSTATTEKVNASLGKDLSQYSGHGFRFMSITLDAEHLRKGTYKNPHSLVFDPLKHIYDVTALLKIIQHMPLAKQQAIYEFLRDELVPPGSERLEESNLASVINIIAKEDLASVSPGETAAGYNVEDKITFNGLSAAAEVIEDYKVFHHKVDRIYTEFDQNAVNKSTSVLDAFRGTYLRLSAQYSGDELFYQIVEEVMTKVRASSNYDKIPVEELQLCVRILAVDAFIRCKIFKKPPEPAHAPA